MERKVNAIVITDAQANDIAAIALIDFPKKYQVSYVWWMQGAKS
jgi:hypothetical protein